ncbi:MAG: VanZ family protein [Eubacteriales bacterium]|nr:VanZ family protein [Eubacteriales bacterium]
MIINTSRNQKLCWILFIIYLIGLTYFTFFAEALGRANVLEAGQAIKFNLVPFREIKRFWIYREQLGYGAFILNIFGNVLAFIPCGFLLSVISRRCRFFALNMVIGLFISFLIECTQLLFRVGSFDVDDMILNTLGVCLGYAAYVLVQHLRAARRKKKERRIVKIRQIDPDEYIDFDKSR